MQLKKLVLILALHHFTAGAVRLILVSFGQSQEQRNVLRFVPLQLVRWPLPQWLALQLIQTLHLAVRQIFSHLVYLGAPLFVLVFKLAEPLRPLFSPLATWILVWRLAWCRPKAVSHYVAICPPSIRFVVA